MEGVDTMQLDDILERAQKLSEELEARKLLEKSEVKEKTDLFSVEYGNARVTAWVIPEEKVPHFSREDLYHLGFDLFVWENVTDSTVEKVRNVMEEIEKENPRLRSEEGSLLPLSLSLTGHIYRDNDIRGHLGGVIYYYRLFDPANICVVCLKLSSNTIRGFYRGRIGSEILRKTCEEFLKYNIINKWGYVPKDIL